MEESKERDVFATQALGKTLAMYPKCKLATKNGAKCATGFTFRVDNDNINCQMYCSQHLERWIIALIRSLATSFEYEGKHIPIVYKRISMELTTEDNSSQSFDCEQKNNTWDVTFIKRDDNGEEIGRDLAFVRLTDERLVQVLVWRFKIMPIAAIRVVQSSIDLPVKVYGPPPANEEQLTKFRKGVEYSNKSLGWKLDINSDNERAFDSGSKAASNQERFKEEQKQNIFRFQRNLYEPTWSFSTELTFGLQQQRFLPVKQTSQEKCTNRVDFITQNPVSQAPKRGMLDSEWRISFIVPTGQIYCFDRNVLYAYWKSEGGSISGACGSTCSRFFKLPFGQYAYIYTSFADDLKLRSEVSTWRLILWDIITIGRNTEEINYSQPASVDRGLVYLLQPAYEYDDS